MKTATALLALLLIACAKTPPPEPPADVVVVNGDVRTMDPAQPLATAFAVRDGRIVSVGADEDVRKNAGPQTQIVDAQGHTVLPGLIDSHIHAAEGALARGGCSLEDKELTIEAAGPRIRACFA